MVLLVSLLVAAVLGIWFGRRLGPALLAVLVVLTVPVWLVGGLLLDLARRAWSGIRPGPRPPSLTPKRKDQN